MLFPVDLDFAFVSFCCLGQEEPLASESLEVFRIDCFEAQFVGFVVHTFNACKRAVHGESYALAVPDLEYSRREVPAVNFATRGLQPLEK